MTASTKIMVIAALLVAICTVATVSPVLLNAEQDTAYSESEVVTDESGDATVTADDDGTTPELPEMDGQGMPSGDIEMDGEEITLDDGTVIFVPYLPDGTLPERSEDGTAPGQGMPAMDNGQMPSMNGQGMPGMNNQGMPGMGMDQMGGNDGS